MFLAFQTIVIAFLVLYFAGEKVKAVGYVITYVAAMGFLLSPYASFQLLSLLQTSNAFVVVVSKVRVASPLACGQQGHWLTLDHVDY